MSTSASGHIGEHHHINSMTFRNNEFHSYLSKSKLLKPLTWNVSCHCLLACKKWKPKRFKLSVPMLFSRKVVPEASVIKG